MLIYSDLKKVCRDNRLIQRRKSPDIQLSGKLAYIKVYMQNAIINGLCRLSITSSHDYQCNCRAYKALIVSAKPKTYRTLCRPYD